MTLFILTETSAGYALLKAKDKKLLKRDDIATEASTAEGVSNLYVTLIAFLCHACTVYFAFSIHRRKFFWSRNGLTNETGSS